MLVPVCFFPGSACTLTHIRVLAKYLGASASRQMFAEYTIQTCSFTLRKMSIYYYHSSNIDKHLYTIICQRMFAQYTPVVNIRVFPKHLSVNIS